MKYAERKQLMAELNPEQLAGSTTPTAKADGYFRWHVLQLLADIADHQDSLDYTYKEMLKLQQGKAGAAAARRSTGAVSASSPAGATEQPLAKSPAPAISPTPASESRYGNRSAK